MDTVIALVNGDNDFFFKPKQVDEDGQSIRGKHWKIQTFFFDVAIK